MSWRLSSPPRPVDLRGADGHAWDLDLEDGSRAHRTRFTVSGTAMAMLDEALPAGGAQARASGGVSAVEPMLAWSDPPRRIDLSSTGLRSLGGRRTPLSRQS